MKKALAANTITPLFAQLTRIASGFIVPRLILSHYGSQMNGLITSISQFLAIISFMEMGVGSVVRYNFYSPLSNNDNYKLSCVYSSAKKYFRLIAKILFIYIVLLVFLYPILVNSQVDSIISISLIVILSISSFAQFYFGQVNQILLVADQKSYITSSIQIITVVLNTVFVALLIEIGASIFVVKLVSAIVFAFQPFVYNLYVYKHYSIIADVKYEGEPITQKWNGMAQHISSVVLEQTDVIVLTVFSSLVNVSIYSIYHQVVYGIKILMLSMTNGIEALIGSLIAKDKTEELESVFNQTEWVIHFITTLIFSCTIVLIVPFVLVYTKGVDDANYNVPIFALLITIANAGHCLRLPYNILILAAGHYKQTQHVYLISAVMNIIISIIFVNKFGLTGVAVGTIVSMVYQTIWMAYYSSKIILKRRIFIFVKQLIIDVFSFVLVYFSTSFILLGDYSYFSWIIMALKCFFIALTIICLINIVFYKKQIIRVFSILKKD